MIRASALLFVLLVIASHTGYGQVRFLLEDFEGLASGQEAFHEEGIYTYGSAKAVADKSNTTGKGYSGDRCIRISWNGRETFGGWGKGIGMNMQLDAATDNLNFYLYTQSFTGTAHIKVGLTEDDNGNDAFSGDHDDEWVSTVTVNGKNEWQLISIPVSAFTDNNHGGDGKFNVTYKDGKLLTFSVRFPEKEGIPSGSSWYFDFICFSKGKLNTGASVFEPVSAKQGDFCLLGAWSDVGYDADFTLISNNFQNNLKVNEKRLGVIHFFLPLASDGGRNPNTYPNVNRLNTLINQGFTPMITMEMQYVQVPKNGPQPNLYTIIEGHLDQYLIRWAKTAKQVQGTVLLRLMHEFNGDWYPWCIANNDQRPELYIKAFQHVWNIFKAQDATNVKFVWCPNSRSFPQTSWNYIMDAYPGDTYVDYVGVDVYNGAHGGLWRSFRREITETYFLFNEFTPNKPILICETASRERNSNEKGEVQDKARWIEQMSEAIKTDMSGVRLINWFDQYKMFKINSSNEARNAYIGTIWRDAYYVPQSQWFFK